MGLGMYPSGEPWCSDTRAAETVGPLRHVEGCLVALCHRRTGDLGVPKVEAQSKHRHNLTTLRQWH